MNFDSVNTTQHREININESYFFKMELFLWCFCSSVFMMYWSGFASRFPIIEVLLQLSVILLALYAAVIPFVKTWYNLEDLNSAIFNISGIILLTIGATASSIYSLPWGENIFMAGFCCTAYYYIQTPFREKTYQNTNTEENKLIILFVLGCLISFPACFIHEDLFPFRSVLFLYAAGLGFLILAYTLFSFCQKWYQGVVSNYLLLSYTPRLLVMLYFAKGYEQFMIFDSLLQ